MCIRDRSGTVPEQLEKLYQQFNLEKPVDYHRPSMSVSDIVAIKQDEMCIRDRILSTCSWE